MQPRGLSSEAANDSLLQPVCHASDAPAREHAIAGIITTVAEPLARKILSRYTRGSAGVTAEDAEDLLATVTLRLINKLRAVAAGEERIGDFAGYVGTLTYNAVHDHLRRCFPNRTRLRNRLRYLLTDDERLALWTSPAGLTAGLSAWSGTPDVLSSFPLTPESATRPMFDVQRPADALVEIFRVTARPMTFKALIDGVASLWEISDAPPAAVLEPVSDAAARGIEARDMLRALWSEIRALPLPQRKALLLNLRDRESADAISVLVFHSIATFDEIAAAMEISAEDLGALWNRLPLDDNSIADILGLTRQQVINLRKSARDRLARRVFGRKR